jgi:SAM-dependent methyltransferase
MLPLKHQNNLRERYRKIRPDWRSSGEIFEQTVYNYLGNHNRILDIGCGRGGLSEKLVYQGNQVYGFDIDWHSMMSHRDSLIQLCAGHSDFLPIKSFSHQIIIASWLLEHLSDPLTSFREIRRVLAPGGHFIFLTPNKNNPIVMSNISSKLVPRLQSILVERLYERERTDTFPVFYLANTYKTLQILAKQSGLQLIDLAIIKDPTYTAFNEVLFKTSILLDKLMPKMWGIHLVGVLKRPYHA